MLGGKPAPGALVNRYGLVFAGAFLAFPATQRSPCDRIALYGIAFDRDGALIVVGFPHRETWLTPGRAVAGLDDSGQLLIEIGIIGTVAALVVGIVNRAGLGLVFSQIPRSISGGSMPLLPLLTAPANIALAFVAAIIGFAVALQGYYTRAVAWFVRATLAVAAILSLVDIVEVGIAGAVLVFDLVGWLHVGTARR